MPAFIVILLLGALFGAALFALARREPGGGPWDAALDSDARRVAHDVDAIRTRFEEHPVWPSPGALGERR